MAKRKKKLNAGFNFIEPGQTIAGVLGETIQVQGKGKNYASTFFELSDPKTGEVKQWYMDGGLKGAFSLAKVLPGMHIEIVHTGERMVEGFEDEMRTYDIFELED